MLGIKPEKFRRRLVLIASKEVPDLLDIVLASKFLKAKTQIIN